MAALSPGTQFILHVHELNPGNGEHTLHDLLFVTPFTVEKILDRLRLLLCDFNEALVFSLWNSQEGKAGPVISPDNIPTGRLSTNDRLHVEVRARDSVLAQTVTAAGENVNNQGGARGLGSLPPLFSRKMTELCNIYAVLDPNKTDGTFAVFK